MSENFCEWDHEEECDERPLLCGEPASVRIRNVWYCETHADQTERILVSEEKIPSEMEDIDP